MSVLFTCIALRFLIFLYRCCYSDYFLNMSRQFTRIFVEENLESQQSCRLNGSNLLLVLFKDENFYTTCLTYNSVSVFITVKRTRTVQKDLNLKKLEAREKKAIAEHFCCENTLLLFIKLEKIIHILRNNVS